ncbi:MAG TPA: HU family DNA-binding protein [Aggregatilineales bacterium]|nr:HU family DNA-binding protein [Aggregatilineales bacterium]
MTLTKNKMVREIGRRTRLKNRDVQAMLEALVEVWSEELVSGGRIELEGLFVIESLTVDRGEQSGHLRSGTAPRYIRRVVVRVSRSVRRRLMLPSDESNTRRFRDRDE